MLNEKNITALKALAQSLGFEDGLESDLRKVVCFAPASFEVSKRLARGKDVCSATIYFEKNKTEYACLYYDVTMRKDIVLLDSDLLFAMQKIDWLLPEKYCKEIDAVMDELNKLTDQVLANKLKIKFWIDTPAEIYIPGLNVLRNQFEITQRFYFFENEQPITLDEAIRFLTIRWLEKQQAAKKKTEVVEEARSGAVPKKKRLLIKKRKRDGNGLM